MECRSAMFFSREEHCWLQRCTCEGQAVLLEQLAYLTTSITLSQTSCNPNFLPEGPPVSWHCLASCVPTHCHAGLPSVLQDINQATYERVQRMDAHQAAPGVLTRMQQPCLQLSAHLSCSTSSGSCYSVDDSGHVSAQFCVQVPCPQQQQ